MSNDKGPIEGCNPNFRPDQGLADRSFDAVSIEDQIKSERLRWPTDPENPEFKPAPAPEPDDEQAHG